MDESRSLKIPAGVGFLFQCFGRLLPLPLALAACLASEPRGLPRVSSEAFSRLAKEISELRQLPLKRDLALDEADGEAGAVANPYYGGMPLAAIESAYRAVGLLRRETELNPALADYRRLERLAAYNETGGKVWLSRNLARLSSALESTRPSIAAELPAVFAIVAALQEQHFKWRARTDAVSLEDRRLAFRAVGAGDLVLTLLLRAGTAKADLAAANAQVADPIGRELDRLGERLPPFLRQQLAFPYAEGARFVLWAYQAKGWSGIDALYDNPPLSTAELLHPEKYFLRRQLPLRFFPPALLRRFPEGAMVEQSFGEYLIRGLLASAYGAASAARLAAAWRGDQFFSFAGRPALTAIWFSSWESASAAEEFLLAYRSVLEARHRLRFERSAHAGLPALGAAARDGRGWLLQARGSAVIFVHAGSKEALADLAEHAWKDLEIEPESTAIPFETAGFRNQLSFKSR